MTTLTKLATIQKRKNIYAILFRNAGVAIQFFEPPAGGESHLRIEHDDSWKKFLVVNRYYATFAEAVEAAYRELVAVHRGPGVTDRKQHHALIVKWLIANAKTLTPLEAAWRLKRAGFYRKSTYVGDVRRTVTRMMTDLGFIT